jgi:hypothetical protein
MGAQMGAEVGFMKRLILAGLVLAASLAHAQTVDRVILRDYDLDSVDAVLYACLGDPQSSGPYKATTIDGGSTTVTSLPATGVGAFRNIAVGDEISLTIAGTETRVIVATRASDYSITVSDTIDLYNAGNGYPFTFRKLTTGTGADICWVNIKTYHNKSLTVELNQTDAGDGLAWRVECKSALPGALPVIAWPADSDSSCGPGSYIAGGYCGIPTASAGIAGRVTWQDVANWSQCRVGLYLVTSDASDATTDAEKISVYLSADKP